jgi:uncharacterized protein YndB with AHSA1/START domain
MQKNITINANLDLVFEKYTSLTPEQIWKGWTDPNTLKKWFCPKPWKVTECRTDLQVGGEFYTLMEGPAGEKMSNHGCYLEVIPNKKLVWTNMMSQGLQPATTEVMGFPFVAIITLLKTESDTHFKAVLKHADEAGRKKHEQMGFQEGWGMAFLQLEELMKNAS